MAGIWADGVGITDPGLKLLGQSVVHRPLSPKQRNLVSPQSSTGKHLRAQGVETTCGQVAREGPGQTGAPTGTFKGSWNRLTHYPKQAWNKQRKNTFPEETAEQTWENGNGVLQEMRMPLGWRGCASLEDTQPRPCMSECGTRQEPQPALPTPHGGRRVCSAFPERGLQSLLQGDRLRGG